MGFGNREAGVARKRTRRAAQGLKAREADAARKRHPAVKEAGAARKRTRRAAQGSEAKETDAARKRTRRAAQGPEAKPSLPGAAVLASEAKQFGISVATLKTLYRTPTHPYPSLNFAPMPLLYSTSEKYLHRQPGRAAMTKPRYTNHDGTRFMDLSVDED
eukprot:jgi/Tetstr1/457391/TSEL_043993.t1